MTTKQSHQDSEEIDYSLFCNALEKQYKQAKKEGVFEVLRVLELDKEHSDGNIVQAIGYFNEKEGVVESDAPMAFLTEQEKSIVNQNGKFRPALYCMLLVKKFSEAIENKSAYLKNSFKYSVNS